MRLFPRAWRSSRILLTCLILLFLLCAITSAALAEGPPGGSSAAAQAAAAQGGAVAHTRPAGAFTRSASPATAYAPGLNIAVTAVATGGNHTCALTINGGVKCWGNNDYGQLGDGTQALNSSPVDVVGLGSGVVAITAGAWHTCALTSSGGVKCWGDAVFGELGDGTSGFGQYSSTPVDVTGLTSGIAAVVAGGTHTCAITTAGALKCWGDNYSGQLGNGSAGPGQISATPVNVGGLGSVNVAAVAVGGAHTCALMGDTAVKCWGSNGYGQLGNGSGGFGQQSATPVNVSSLGLGTVAIVAGDNHTCALANSGTVKCWGRNDAGQVGNGTNTDSKTPVSVVTSVGGPALNNVIVLTAGSSHTCASTSGTAGVKCWGDNSTGQLGNMSLTSSNVPVDVLASPLAGALKASAAQTGSSLLSIVAVVAGGGHTCVLGSVAGVICWGSNLYGQLGDAQSGNFSAVPVGVFGLSSGILQMSVGVWHACAVTTDNHVRCWGSDQYGQLGNGFVSGVNPMPLTVIDNATGQALADIIQVAAGGDHTCALTKTGGVKCWGGNYAGQLGDGTTTQRTKAVDVVGLQSGVVQVSAGDNHTCAVMATGGIKCWGANYGGQLGNGTTTDSLVPVDVTLPPGKTAVAVSAGNAFTCALLNDGSVVCWGNNGVSGQSSTPVAVTGLGGPATAITAGGGQACALLATGGIKCWGQNSSGQLGNGTTANSSTPVDVIAPTMMASAGRANGVSSTPLINAKAVEAGYFHTCALLNDGSVLCWGNNQSGQLGVPTVVSYSATPVVVTLSGPMQALSAGGFSTCALSAGGGLTCWGNNVYGQLGAGVMNFVTSPVNLVKSIGTLAAGSASTCLLTGSDVLKCWGSNSAGQLGNPAAGVSSSSPVNVVVSPGGNPLPNVTQVAAGGDHTCARISDGSVQCWGNNGAGQLGNPVANGSQTPVAVNGLGGPVLQVVAGDSHTCALMADGTVKCWGANNVGQLGDGTTGGGGATPVTVVKADTTTLTNVVFLAAGGDHTCALIAGGTVKCWGSNSMGELGNPAAVGNSPKAVDALTQNQGAPLKDVVTLAAGGSHTCAAQFSGQVVCWGSNAAGQLGNPSAGGMSGMAVTVLAASGGPPLTDVDTLGAGGSHTCAIVAGGGVKCWGANAAGQLGNTGAGANAATPVDVTGLASGAVAITAGGSHTCVLKSSNVVTCWGGNGSLQLGNAGAGGASPSTVGGLTQPVAFTGSSSTSGTSATLNGQVIANATQASYWFQYAQSFRYGVQSPAGSASGSGVTGVLVALNNLSPGPYHYRTDAQNSAGVALGLNQWVPPIGTPTNVIFTAFTSSATGSTVTLKWTTATEINIVGFRLYRSQHENDGFQAIGTDLIPAQLEPGGASYTYDDANMPNGQWYYRIEAVNGTGQTVAADGPTAVVVGGPNYRLFLPLLAARASSLR